MAPRPPRGAKTNGAWWRSPLWVLAVGSGAAVAGPQPSTIVADGPEVTEIPVTAPSGTGLLSGDDGGSTEAVGVGWAETSFEVVDGVERVFAVRAPRTPAVPPDETPSPPTDTGIADAGTTTTSATTPISATPTPTTTVPVMPTTNTIPPAARAEPAAIAGPPPTTLAPAAGADPATIAVAPPTTIPPAAGAEAETTTAPPTVTSPTIPPAAPAEPAPTAVPPTVTTTTIPLTTTTSTPPPAAPEPIEQHLVDLANQERIRAGRAPLEVDVDIREVARNWSGEMSRSAGGCSSGGGLQHNLDYATEMPVGWSRAAENVGCGPSVEWIHQALMDSSLHRENILDEGFTRVGVGVAIALDGTIWVTQNFGQF